VRAYRAIIERFIQEFGDGPVDQVTPEQILTYLNRLTEGNKPYTKRIRFSQLSSFFNFVRNNIDPELQESMRQAHDPQAVSGKGAFEMENHRKGNH
jgi:integrase/recombinase XerD